MIPTVQKYTACLHIIGDDLIPDEISSLLGCKPTASSIKGERKITEDLRREYISEEGRWCLIPRGMEKKAYNEQILDILNQLNSDISIWQELRKKYDLQMHSGLFMIEPNEILNISSETLMKLGLRGIRLEFDLYAPFEDDFFNSKSLN